MTQEAGQRDADATRRTLRWLLGGQLALAVALVAIDIGPSIPRFLSPSSQPELDMPTTPGDQTRRFRPRNPTNPGPGLSPDMPRRLIAQETEIDGQPALALRGGISTGDGNRIVEELRAANPALVTIDSPGGSVADALEIGRHLRAEGINTRLAADAVCLSACPYIFVGGVAREIEEGARLGVHQHSFGESTILPAFLAVENIQRGHAEVLAHFDDMGIDLRIMGPALATPANEIYILSRDEISDWNLTTE